ncbi:hypothetical protein F2P81_018468 [Scophthalmus maximus]|uniref:Uncharacterized protein n=1 Tax=Scophthalmus maximus TaxID=52904 RepID=A0A6A4S4T2_SCOMX|nr:hypothetical protein F2P81_018468 [Scophthalmus maximus]
MVVGSNTSQTSKRRSALTETPLLLASAEQLVSGTEGILLRPHRLRMAAYLSSSDKAKQSATSYVHCFIQGTFFRRCVVESTVGKLEITKKSTSKQTHKNGIKCYVNFSGIFAKVGKFNRQPRRRQLFVC